MHISDWSPEFKQGVRNWLTAERARLIKAMREEFPPPSEWVMEVTCHLATSLGGLSKLQFGQCKVRDFRERNIEFSVPEIFTTYDGSWGSYWFFLGHRRAWRIEVTGHQTPARNHTYLHVVARDEGEPRPYYYHPSLAMHELFFLAHPRQGESLCVNWLSEPESHSLLSSRKLRQLKEIAQGQVSRANLQSRVFSMLCWVAELVEEGNFKDARKSLAMYMEGPEEHPPEYMRICHAVLHQLNEREAKAGAASVDAEAHS